MEAGDWALADVQRVVARALETDGHVLSAGEGVLARRLLALEGPAGRLWARLVGRRGDVFRVGQLSYTDVPDPAAAIAALGALDLVHGSVPESLQVACYTVAELQGVCRRVGARSTGKRAVLEARLAEHPGWSQEPAVRVAGGGLLRRLEALCFQDRRQDRSVWLLERLGVTRWPTYELTVPQVAFRSRAALLAWAAPIPEDLAPEVLLTRLQALPGRPRWQRRLCLRRRLERRLVTACRELERAGEPGRAVTLYAALLEAGATHPGEVAIRLALAHEAAGDPSGGLAAATLWRPQAEVVSRVALDRVGRRLARGGRGAWAPDRPRRIPLERRMTLPRATVAGPRPLWGDPPLVVEQAVARAVPRRVLAAENALWTTLSGLLLLDLWWLPVPGMLPTTNLSGPLDLGTPDFAAHRRQPLDGRLAQLRQGQAPQLLRRSWRHHGERLRGVDWGLASLGELEACAVGLGGPALAAVVGRLAQEGWSAAVGLPDLAILPGPACRLAGCFPGGLGEGLVLAEVKSPGDTVRDAQAVWFDHLLHAGAQVELWRVQAPPKR